MILMASASRDVLMRCGQGAQEFGLTSAVCDYPTLLGTVTQLKPRLLLIDLELPGLVTLQDIAKLRQHDTGMHIIVLGRDLSEGAELAVFKYGASGYCPLDAPSHEIRRVVDAVSRGEVWMRRMLCWRLLDELQSYHRAAIDEGDSSPALSTLNELTPREQQIATLVSEGRSNKEVARRLQITERTVKSHLTEVFRTLGVRDRVMLALHVHGNARFEAGAMQAAPKHVI